MQRRELLQAMFAAGLLPATAITGRMAQAQSVRYDGPVYLVVFAEGGWDVTSFCDPKDGLIVPSGQQVAVPINHWSAEHSIATTANGIAYAPFANNAELFTAHSSKMMVMNGLDAQTNAHSAGVRHVFSGRFADGYPAITALAAAKHGAGLPLAFLSNGAYRETAGLTNFSLMQDPATLGNLINTNMPPEWAGSQYHRPEQLTLIEQFKLQRLDRLQARQQLATRLRDAAGFMESSAAGRDQLQALNDFMPEDLASTVDEEGNWFPMLRQIQLSLVAMASGLTVAADVVNWGFDTHANHDVDQGRALRRLASGIDYIWQQAAAMDADYGSNLTQRLRVVIASDFSRTPWYNDGNGKDHWPIGSAILMKQGGFARSVVGATTATHSALGLNAQLNAEAEQGAGTIITPAHFQQLLRRWADVDSTFAGAFPLASDGLDLRPLLG